MVCRQRVHAARVVGLPFWNALLSPMDQHEDQHETACKIDSRAFQAYAWCVCCALVSGMRICGPASCCCSQMQCGRQAVACWQCTALAYTAGGRVGAVCSAGWCTACHGSGAVSLLLRLLLLLSILYTNLVSRLPVTPCQMTRTWQ